MNPQSPKLPPNSLESEQSVLGGLMLHNEAWEQVSEIISRDDFYTASHKIIFDAAKVLLDHNEPADVLTVNEQVKKNGKEKSSGGFSYLAEIAENTPSIANIETYAKYVRELSVYRQLISISQEIAGHAYNPKDTEAETLIEFSEQKIFEIAEQVGRNKKSTILVKDMVKDVVNRVQEMQDNQGGISGLETGFTELDKMTSGLQNGDLVIIAGRPSMGKTAIAMNIIEHVAIKSKTPKPVVVFSLEMPINQLVMRMISGFARIEISKMRDGRMSEADWVNFNHAVKALEEHTILIDETPSITAQMIRTKSRRLKRQYPDLALIMIDYLQLMSVAGKGENRNQEISEISRLLKALAKELDVPVIAISQLNRGVESRAKTKKGRMPQMADLRESGSIEQDADIIGFVYRDEAYFDDGYSNPEEEGKADLKIAKHRNGAIGMIPLAFVKQYARFENLASSSHTQEIEESYGETTIDLGEQEL